MSEAHIRDYLAVTRAEMKQGKVSTTAMCGASDPKMNTLTFADPKSVVRRKLDHVCQKCRNKWVSQEEATGDQARAIHKFRKISGKMSRFGSK